MSGRVTIRPAKVSDAEAVWVWRNDPETRAASLDTAAIPLTDHRAWFSRTLANPDRRIFMVVANREEMGFVRLDRADETATVSIALAPSARGEGLGTPALLAAITACPWPVSVFKALVRPGNRPSRALFERCGFHLKIDSDPLVYETRNTTTLVIVLANSLLQDGTPGAESAARLACAAELVAQNPAATLVTSGWAYARNPSHPIADLMARAATDSHGLDPSRILQSPRARDTVGDAVFLAADILPDLPPPAVVTVVTSAYHAPRAEEVFGFVLAGRAPIRVIPTDEPVTGEQRTREATSLAAFRRTFDGIAPGDLPAILDRLWTAHPLYNGEIYGPDSPGVIV